MGTYKANINKLNSKLIMYIFCKDKKNNLKSQGKTLFFLLSND